MANDYPAARRRRWFVGAVAYLVAAPACAWLVWRIADMRASIFATQFGFGAVVESLLAGRGFAGPCPFAGCDVMFHAHRMPLIPLFLAAVAVFRDSMLAACIAKALVFSAFSVAAWAAIRPLVRPRVFWAGLAFVLLFPQIAGRMFDVHTEEGYLIHLQALIAALLLGLAVRGSLPRGGGAALIALNVAVFFTKSGQIVYAATVCLALWRLSRERRLAGFAAGALAAACLVWAGVNAARTGRFTVATSWDAWNFYKGNNERTLSLYPKLHLDLLDREPYPGVTGADEWTVSDQFMRLARQWIVDHPRDAARALSRKLGVALVAVTQNGMLSPATPRFRGLRAIGVIFMVIFRVAFWTLVAVWAREAGRRRRRQPVDPITLRLGVAFLLPAIGFLLPYLAGFVYERHLTPLVVPTVFAAMILFGRRAHQAQATGDQ
jgi:hypothetical protein